MPVKPKNTINSAALPPAERSARARLAACKRWARAADAKAAAKWAQVEQARADLEALQAGQPGRDGTAA